ncbi:MAG: hypothetical protein HYT39_00310 [Candidatus Sungbacteria bacterium]|nr:hypothetical protein [Candidatus Sungbacteria bacterium]
MKQKWGRIPFVLLAAAAVMLAGVPTLARAFEPTRLLQWNQEERLSANILGRYFLLNNRPVQRGTPESSSSAAWEYGLRLQYRILEVPSLGKLEAYADSEGFTHEDVFDSWQVLVQLGWTLRNFRVSLGHLRELNVGRGNQHGDGRHGAFQLWVGPDVKVVDTEKWLVDAYGRYFIKANIQASVSNRLDEGNAMLGEVGLHATYRLLPYLSLNASPYVLADDKVERLGVYPAVIFDVSKKLPFVPAGMSLELGGNFGSSVHRREEVVWFGLNWKLK